jgi:hypothetical protein
MARSRSIQPIIAFIQQNEDYPEEGRPTKIYEASGLGINQRSGENTGEIWADVFASWAAGSFGREPFASSWRDFIEGLMSDVATSIALGL